ncbi:MAG: hypothetical protein ACREDM_16220, partial [Methylocella sp.]
MIEARTIAAAAAIRLLQSIEALYSTLAFIHVFPGNARYHHARLVTGWLARPGRVLLMSLPNDCAALLPALE